MQFELTIPALPDGTPRRQLRIDAPSWHEALANGVQQAGLPWRGMAGCYIEQVGDTRRVSLAGLADPLLLAPAGAQQVVAGGAQAPATTHPAQPAQPAPVAPIAQQPASGGGGGWTSAPAAPGGWFNPQDAYASSAPQQPAQPVQQQPVQQQYVQPAQQPTPQQPTPQQHVQPAQQPAPQQPIPQQPMHQPVQQQPAPQQNVQPAQQQGPQQQPAHQAATLPATDAPSATPTDGRLEAETEAWAEESQMALEDIFLEMPGIFAPGVTAPDAIDFIVDTARKYLPSEYVAVFLVDDMAEEIYCAQARGKGVRQLLDATFPLDAGFIGYCIRNGVGLSCSDPTNDKRDDATFTRVTGIDVRSIACGPIQYQERTFGVLALFNREGHTHFSQGDLNVVNYIGAQMGEFLQRQIDSDTSALG